MRRVKSPLSDEPNAIVGRYLSRVRTVGLVLVVSLVMAVASPAPARASTAELVQQLDECDLTFRDVEKIKDAFCELLLGVYHERIPYPEDRITRIKPAASG